MTSLSLQPTRVLTPEGFRPDLAVLVDAGRIAAVVPAAKCPGGVERRPLAGDLVPGFLDLQVNGGGGVLFNDQPTVEGIAAIGAAHRRFGTTGFLPTLISDDLAVVRRAMAAVDAAIEQGIPAVLGIHLEGPFLNPAKKGIHDAAAFRVLDEEAVALLTSLRGGRTLVTLAPELAPPGAIRALVAGGAMVAAGHTAATYDQLRAAFAEGLSGFTHLFNAMTPLGSREPGAVGAALDHRAAWCSLIVDGDHVHPASMRIALAAKGAERLALITDAMPTVGSDRREFRLGGQVIAAEGSHCVAADGTLAGSNLSMAGAVANAERLLGVDLATAVAMASRTPAAILGLAGQRGTITQGMSADLVLLDSERRVVETWIGGMSALG